jgi:hypothetical protein
MHEWIEERLKKKQDWTTRQKDQVEVEEIRNRE